MGGVLKGGNPVRTDWFGLAGLAGLVIIVSLSRSRRVRLDQQLLSSGIFLVSDVRRLWLFGGNHGFPIISDLKGTPVFWNSSPL